MNLCDIHREFNRKKTFNFACPPNWRELSTFNSKGFTLIELLIVVFLVAGLAFVASKVINPFLELQISNDETRKKDLAKISLGVEMYYQQFGVYPLNPKPFDYRIRGFKTDHPIIDWGQEWSPFVDIMPKDPKFPSLTYVYYAPSDGQAYYMYASLERGGADEAACKKDGSKCDQAPVLENGKNACGGVCSYGISSRNVTP